jgi:hypothetical protein
MKERAYQVIAARIGDHAGISGVFGSVTWKRVKDSTVVQWRPLAEDAIGLLRARGVSAEEIEAVVRKNTVTKPGYRTMRTKPAPHLVFEDTIALQLPATTTTEGEEDNS